jgi:creatinine amidohydrolase
VRAALRLGEMTREEIRQVAAETVVVLPTASVEQHGPHLPILTDSIICEAVCARAAEEAAAEISVTVSPILPYGLSRHHLPYPGVLSLTSATYIRAIAEVCETLAKSGFRRIAIVNGHGGNDEAIRLAARDVMNDYPVTILAASYWSLVGPAVTEAARNAAVEPVPGHAGGFETSLVLALRPDLVRGRPPALAESSGRLSRRIGDGPGYSDDAAAASAETGHHLLRLIVGDVARVLVTLCRQA